MFIYTAERVGQYRMTDHVNLQRHLFAYHYATSIVKGNIIEVGCGQGYGMNILAEYSDHYVAIDKKAPGAMPVNRSIDFFKMLLPRLKNIPSNMFDCVVSFQVIEHIPGDEFFVQELHRVLKPGGVLLMTTPNRLSSLTRNPWHVREYTAAELERLVKPLFTHVCMAGISGNEKVNRYMDHNRQQVQRITRYDVFNLQYRLPAWLLRIPYDALNFISKQRMQKSTGAGATSIAYDDFKLGPAEDQCLDLLVHAVK